MTSEFDWFMVTMPIFAIVVYLIVMVGAMEKQPKFLEEAGVKKIVGIAFVGLFGGGILISFYYMIKWFIFLVGNYWSNTLCPSTNSIARIVIRIRKFWFVPVSGKVTQTVHLADQLNLKKSFPCSLLQLPKVLLWKFLPAQECQAIAGGVALITNRV